VTELPGPLLEDYRARLAEPGHDEGGGNDIKDEMPYLLARAQQYPGLRVLEIGVRSGRSTSAFLAAASRSMNGGHVWSVDVNTPQVPARWAECGYWTFKQARSGDVTPELEGWPTSYHVLFIDGDHTLPAVLGDQRRFVPYVAPGGVVLCHDTKLKDPARPDAPPDVARALDLFCAEYHLAARELPWDRGNIVTPGRLTWTERGGRFGLGVVEAPNG
jgi:predicted O-methyltransferase YrrM